VAQLVVRAAPSFNAAIGMTSHVALVVTVNDGTGKPVTGLQASNFHVSDTFGHAGTDVSQAIASFEAFREHEVTKGAYTIGLGGGFIGQMPIIVVDVTRGRDRGRAMTQVRF
jgi:hypothetical protein